MKTTHTPGPWEPLRQGTEIQSYEGLHEVSAIAENGAHLSICVVSEGHFTNATQNGIDEPEYTISSDEAYSNACLIAAAPELLEALENLTDAVQSATSYADDTAAGKALSILSGRSGTKWLSDARAAIAKARGMP